ncbi:quinone oxidoreductase family protein [Cryptosporangium minutisporangium]|uniref:NADP-dependent oxidoreductase n=1 Tax=Cryptosporangium minutisporangium TaxID=113569 RepID=A0ABP6SXH8_9ACTN
MRAYLLPAEGAQPELTQAPPPEPAPDEVLVRVHTSSVTPHDAIVASGAAARYMTYRFPVVLGSDLAGTVEAVGAEVSDLSPGDRVFGLVRELVAARGSFAELVSVPREWVCRTPETVDDTSAGALGLAALTALRCVDAIEAGAGDVVLVNGATGGVGSYAIQLLAARGAAVVATARPGEEARHVRELGAVDVVDWTGGDLAERVRTLHPDGVTAIIDLVNRDPANLADLADPVLAPAGRVASTGHAADPDRSGSTNIRAGVDQDALRTIAELAGDGRLRAPITRTFDLADLDRAFAALGGGAVGKIAIRI